MNSPIKLLTPSECAQILGVRVETLTRMRAEGRGPAYIADSTRLVRYTEQAILRWIAEAEKASQAPRPAPAPRKRPTPRPVDPNPARPYSFRLSARAVAHAAKAAKQTVEAFIAQHVELGAAEIQPDGSLRIFPNLRPSEHVNGAAE